MQKETNMAGASRMICKIGLIWRHMKTLYGLVSREQDRFSHWSVSWCILCLMKILYVYIDLF